MSHDEAATPVRCDVVLEQTLGHVTHGQNLRRLLPHQPGLDPTFVEVQYEVDGWSRYVPGYQNWTIRAGWRARRGVRALGRDHERDVLFVHSQVPAVLLGSVMSRIPTIVSLDATPKQYDELGAHYAHETGPALAETAKLRLNARCFRRAAHLVTWARWTKGSLVDDYGVDPEKITVIPPGVDLGLWSPDDERELAPDEPVRILFVGGDLARKGGDDLIASFAQIRAGFGAAVELHIVSRARVDAVDGVTVHRDMTPNSRDLIDLYHRCHIFCLPTRGDCLPMVLPEAAAAGLALVSTDVGAISEIVRDGETGLLVPVGEREKMSEALGRLIRDPDLRNRLALRGSALVREDHDAAINARRLSDLIREVAGRARRSQVAGRAT